MWAAVAALLCTAAAAASAPEENLPPYNPFCPGTLAQDNLDLDQVLGKWYAVEIVHHRDDGVTPRGRQVVNSCPVLSLSRSPGNGIRLNWDEKPGHITYNFRVDDHKPGLWISTGPQNGSLLYTSGTYRQFAGTVEVAKAVWSHVVLTFCAPASELYSVVMSKTPKLPLAELQGVNKMLESRGLKKYVVRAACKNSASSTPLSIFALLSSLFLLLRNYPS